MNTLVLPLVTNLSVRFATYMTYLRSISNVHTRVRIQTTSFTERFATLFTDMLSISPMHRHVSI